MADEQAEHDSSVLRISDAFTDRDHGRLRALAREGVSRDPQLRCMRHPLGFFHFLLATAPPVSVRLHYWPSDLRPEPIAATPFHDHVWELQSCVLLGEVRNRLFEARDDSDGEYLLAAIEQVSGVDTVVPTEQRVSLDQLSDELHRAGSIYGIGPRVFHCTEIQPDLAVLTLVRAEITVSGGPRTVVPVGSGAHAPARTYADSQEAQRLRREILDLLA